MKTRIFFLAALMSLLTLGASAATLYVSPNGAGRGADGLSPQTALKDLQKACDKAQDGDIIKIAEGNYLGSQNAGYIEVRHWITLEGGWNLDFTERDPLKYITKIEPTVEQRGTNGSKGLITLSGLDDVMTQKPKGTVTIDGIMFNYGFENAYKPNNPDDERNGCPSKAFETGRMLDDQSQQLSHQIIKSEQGVAGNVIIRNCLIANSPYFGIQFNSRCGEIEICNCVIISNRYGGVRIDGWDKNGEKSHVDFHHNTVAFSWCRDKEMGDMGYGYEFMNKINGDLHHNIFLCNNYAAIARTRALGGPDKVIEAKKVTNVYDNLFFMNAADLQLPSKGGGMWTNVACKDFEDVDEAILPKVEGNREIDAKDAFLKVLDQDYLKGFMNIKTIRSAQYDANSANNQFREAFGMNKQGTETIRVSMYGNRYNFQKAMNLFGAKQGYGAQLPK